MPIRTKATLRLMLAGLLLIVLASACQSTPRRHAALPVSAPDSTGAPSTATPTHGSSSPTGKPTHATSVARATPTHRGSPSRAGSATPSETPTRGNGPVPGGTSETLIGTAYQGAEPSCIGLRVGTTSYELTGNAVANLPHDSYGQALGRFRVVGHLAPPTLASHCMMGRIFDVDTLSKV